MRKLTAGLFVMLDGFVESPERLPARHFDAAVHEARALVCAPKPEVERLAAHQRAGRS